MHLVVRWMKIFISSFCKGFPDISDKIPCIYMSDDVNSRRQSVIKNRPLALFRQHMSDVQFSIFNSENTTGSEILPQLIIFKTIDHLKCYIRLTVSSILI